MNLIISNISDKGTLEKERVVIKILVDTDIGRFGIFKTGKSEKGITNRVYDAYWFPDKPVRAGDFVILYTKPGVLSETINTDGSTSHFFYWGKNGVLWSNDYSCVAVSIPEWKVFGG